MASPSVVSWMSHSMAKFLATAAAAAAGMFSMMPRARSCRPRWATGRAVSQFGARIGRSASDHLENPLDLDRGAALLHRNAGAELALGDQLAFGIETDLAGYKQQVAGAHEAYVIRNRRSRLVQGDALCRQLLLHRSCHCCPLGMFVCPSRVAGL